MNRRIIDPCESRDGRLCRLCAPFQVDRSHHCLANFTKTPFVLGSGSPRSQLDSGSPLAFKYVRWVLVTLAFWCTCWIHLVNALAMVPQHTFAHPWSCWSRQLFRALSILGSRGFEPSDQSCVCPRPPGTRGLYSFPLTVSSLCVSSL